MKGQTVVLIEDNEDAHILIGRAFDKLDMSLNVVNFYNGDEALNWLRRPENLPDLILVDQKMPTMCGIDLVKECRRYPMYKGIPFILMSDDTPDSILARAYDAGIYSCIRKPNNDPIGWGHQFKLAAYYWLKIHRRLDRPMSPKLQAEVREVSASSIDIIDPLNNISKRRD